MAAISKKPARSRTPKKSREELNAEGRERKRQKKHRGNPSGARQQDDARKTGRGAENAVADPRIGSKKPVPLFAEGKTSVKPAVKNRLSRSKPDCLLKRNWQNSRMTSVSMHCCCAWRTTKP